MKKRTFKDIHPLFAVLLVGLAANVIQVSSAWGSSFFPPISRPGAPAPDVGIPWRPPGDPQPDPAGNPCAGGVCNFNIQTKYVEVCTNICIEGHSEFWTPTNASPPKFYRTKTITKETHSATLEYKEDISRRTSAGRWTPGGSLNWTGPSTLTTATAATTTPTRALKSTRKSTQPTAA